jgi:DNA-binding MarR family transcriptional regulator
MSENTQSPSPESTGERGELREYRGWFRVPNALIDAGILAKMERSHLAVYLALSREANPGILACAGLKWLRKATGIKTDRSIIDAIRRLESLGLIRRTNNTAGGRKKRGMYALTVLEKSVPRSSAKRQKTGPGARKDWTPDPETLDPALGNTGPGSRTDKELPDKELPEIKNSTHKEPESLCVSADAGESGVDQSLKAVPDPLVSGYAEWGIRRAELGAAIGKWGRQYVIRVRELVLHKLDRGTVQSAGAFARKVLRDGTADFSELHAPRDPNAIEGFIERNLTDEDRAALPSAEEIANWGKDLPVFDAAAWRGEVKTPA